MRIKTLLLSLLLLFSIGSYAEGETAYAVWCSGNTTLYLTNRAETLSAGDTFTPEGSTEAVTITNVWNGTAVTATATNGTPAWNNTVKGSMTRTVFESSFAEVRPTCLRGWFYQCGKLTTLDGIGNLNTSDVTNMAYMFAGCTATDFTSLDLHTFDTGSVTTMEQMFNGCTTLQTLNLSGWTNTHVQNFYYMFQNCRMLSSLILTGFSTPAATNMRGMFNTCQALTGLDLSHFDTSNTTDMYQMFRGCNNLESLNLSGWANTKVTEMGQMFYECKKLTDLTLTGFATPAATSFNSMFAYCQALESVDLSGFNTSTVRDMQYMFYGCSALTTPTLTGWDTSAVTSMYQMFYNCTSLASLDLSGFDTSALTVTNQMFRGCTKLESLNLSGWANTKVSNMGSMFYDCTKLSDLNLTGFGTAAATNMESMFQNCKALTSLDLSAFDTGLVTTMRNMFYGCAELTDLNVSNWSNPKVSNFSSMFYGCAKLSTLTMTGFETPAATDMSYMFYNSSALTSLDLRGFNTAKVTNMGYMFYGCTLLAALDLSSFNTILVTNMSYMFQNCPALTSLDLSSFNTAKVTNMSYMFSGCAQLADVFVSQTWSTGAVSGSSNMFKDCSSIVGQDGTTYISNSVDKTRATDEAGGYMKTGTLAPDLDEPLAYAIWCADNATLYFLQSTKQLVPGRTFTPDGSDTPVRMTNVWNGTYVIASGGGNPQWYNTVRTALQHVVFEPSFANVTPTSLCAWFRDCVSLTDLTGLEHINAASVTNMNYMFQNCTSLRSLSLPDLNTASVTNMIYMFSGCTSLQSLDLSHLNTANVSNMSYMFSGCTGLQSLDLSHLNTASVNNMAYLFNGCTALQNINFSGLNTANLTNTSYMFQNCTALGTLDLSSFNTAKVSDMKYMFSGCTLLESVYVGSYWAVGYVTYANNHANMFKDCAGIVGQDGTTYDSGSVDKARAHYGNGGYLRLGTEAVGVPEVYAVWCADNTTLYFLKTDKPLIRYGFFKPEGTNTLLTITGLWSGNDVTNITSIPGWYNSARSTLTTVIFDDSFAEVQPTSTYAWFANCTKLTAIEGLEYLNTASVTSMQEMFSNCSLLENIDVSHFDTGNVTTMNKMFNGCSSLQSLNLLGFNIGKVTNIESMFQNCTSLTELDLTSFNVQYTVRQHYLFSGCSNLVSVYVDRWSSSNSGCNDAFKGCTSIVGEYGVTYDPNKTGFGMLGTVTGYFKNGNNPCAIWCADTGMLYFCNINRNKIPQAGASFTPEDGETQTITAIWSGSDVRDSGNSLPGWNSIAADVRQVMIESSFSRVRATSFYGWFEGFTGISSISGMENLKTSSSLATTMSRMFKDCSSLTNLDLIVFKPTNVTDMSEMFSGCAALEAVTVDTDWKTGAVTVSTDMFAGCTSIVGQDGTTYDASVVDKTKAHYATGGYLRGNLHPYVVWISGKGTLYFTAQPSTFDTATTFTPEGSTASYEIAGKWDDVKPDQYSKSPLNNADFNNSNNRRQIYDVVFEPSFSIARPTCMDNWFYGCQNLESVKGLENLNTSEVTSMLSVFDGCSSLVSIDLSPLDVSNVRSMSSMFSGCFQLKNVNLEGWNTSKVEYMSNMFANIRYSNAGLVTLDLSSFDTHNVTYMSNMFAGCHGLQTIYVGEGWDTSKVESSYDMFYNCTDLVGQDGTRFNSNYTDKTRAHYGEGGYLTLRSSKAAYALWCEEVNTLYFTYGEHFSEGGTFTPAGSDTPLTITQLWYDKEVTNCKVYSNGAGTPNWGIYNNNEEHQLKHIVIEPSFVNADLLSLRYWFYNMWYLEDITGMEYLNTTNVTDMSYMFMYGRMEHYDLSHFNTSKVTDMTGMFFNCNLLTSLDVSNFDTSNVTKMGDMFGHCSLLTSLDVSGFDTSNVTDFLSMFNGCSGLESLDVSGFDTSKANSFSMMFKDCTGLTSLDLSNFDTAQGTNFSQIFNGCKNLTSLDISNFDTSHATDMSMMFYNCNNLADLDVSGFNTPNVTQMYAMFAGCRSLPVLDVSSFDTGNVTNMSAMFSNCRGLTTLDVSNFNTANVNILSSMFSYCTGLTTLDVSNFDTSNAEEMSSMFYNCSNLTELDLTSFNTEKVDAMTGMFTGCGSLHSLDLTSFNTSHVALMSEMFKDCTQLERVFVSDLWSTANVKSLYFDSRTGAFYNGTVDVFLNCPAIIGEEGTTYDDTKVSYSYAHIRTDGYLTSNKLYDAEDNSAKIATLNGEKFSVQLKDLKFYKDGTWNTLCLPFALDATQISTLLDAPEKVMTLGTSAYSAATGTLTLNFVEASSIEAGKPYIIRWTPDEAYVNDDEHNLCDPTFTSVTLSNVTADIETDNIDFLGTFAPVSLPAGDKGKLYLDNANTLHQSGNGMTVNAFRGWWQLAEGLEGSDIGDVNGDKTVSITDVTLLVNYILNKQEEGFIVANADVNGDRSISITDVTDLVNFVLNNVGNNWLNIIVNTGDANIGFVLGD